MDKPTLKAISAIRETLGGLVKTTGLLAEQSKDDQKEIIDLKRRVNWACTELSKLLLPQ